MVAIAIGVVSPALAQQREWWAIDLSQAALKLMDAADRSGTARVGVLSLGASDPGMARIAEEVTSQLVWALQAVPHDSVRDVQPIARSQSGRSASVTARAPITISDAARAGQQAAVRYVVTGTIVQSRTELPARVELSLIEVSTGATLETATAAFTFPGTPAAGDSRPLWRSKPFVGTVGAVATLFTGYGAWRTNQDLEAKKAALLAIPAGATAEWTRLHDEASGIAKDRDFWWAVTFGLAGVTASYLVLADSNQIAASTGSASRNWQVAIDPGRRGVSVRRSF
jgi:TolB-like protein